MKAKDFGLYIRKLRNEKKLTIRQLELYSGVSNSYLSQLENGKRGIPSAEVLKKLSSPLGVTQSELMIKAGYIDEAYAYEKPSQLTDKDERDIAKRMKKMKEDLIEGNTDGEGLNFMGEPMSEEAIESLLEALEHAERIATLANKKYTPKKYRKND